jgi:hypothetical protein
MEKIIRFHDPMDSAKKTKQTPLFTLHPSRARKDGVGPRRKIDEELAGAGSHQIEYLKAI